MTRSLTTAVKNHLATNEIKPVHLVNDMQSFGSVGADKDGNILYRYELDVEETL